MATVSFEKRDTNLFFSDRNKDGVPVTSTISTTMCDENGEEMVDESAAAMGSTIDFTVKTLRLTFAKRDTNLIFDKRQV